MDPKNDNKGLIIIFGVFLVFFLGEKIGGEILHFLGDICF
jgi:hypothetical protein